MAIFTYTANKDPHDQTRILRLRDGALVVEMGHAADFYPEEVDQLSLRVVLTPGASGLIEEPGLTQFIRLQDLLDVPRPLSDNDVLAFDFGNGDFKAVQVATAAQLATKQDAATAATDAELTAHANTFGAGGHIPIAGLTTNDVVFTIFDAKADLLVASAADAVARLGVGPNAQVLTADSTAPLGLKWATPDVTQTELDAVLAASVILAPATTARNTVLPTAVGVIPLTIRQAAGEPVATASQQWLDQGGTLMGKFAGAAFQAQYVYDRNGTRPYVSLELGAATIGAQARTATQVPWTVKAAPSQTANLLEAQNSAGTTLFFVDSAGGIQSLTGAGQMMMTTPGGRAALWFGSSPNRSQLQNSSTGVLLFTGVDAINTTLVIKAGTSQAVGTNTLEIQNSGGTVQSRFDSDGTLMLNGAGRAAVGLNAPGAQILGSGGGIGGATLAVRPPGATTVPVLVQGFASQTGDLTQWQDSGAVVLASVSATGGGKFATLGVNATPSATQQLIVAASSTTRVPITAKAFSAQTANLFEAQDSGGTTSAFVSPSGRIGSGFSSGANGQIESRATATTSIPFVARGFVGQTASLQEWQDSTSAVRSYINASGYGNFLRVQVGSGAPATTTALLVTSNGVTDIPIVTKGFASQTGDLFQAQDSAGTTRTVIAAGGGITHLGDQIFTWQRSFAAAAAVRIMRGDVPANSVISLYTDATIKMGGAAAAEDVELRRTAAGTLIQQGIGAATATQSITKMVASQSLDSVQIQNSSSTVLSRFDSTGGLHIPSLQVGASTTAGWVLTADTSGNATWAPAAGGGGSSITLQDEGVALGTQRTTWNLVGVGVTAADDAANGRTNITIPGADLTPTVILAPAASTRNIIQPTAATVVPLVSKGFASQTADLFQAQDSSAVVLAKIDLAGGLVAKSYQTNPIGAEGFSRMFIDPTNTAIDLGGGTLTRDVRLTRTAAGALQLQGIGAATGTNFVVKQVASQATVMQQWQDSAAVVLADINASGGIDVNVNNRTGGTSSFSRTVTFNAGAAATVPLISKGAASQTGNLQEYQDSAATVLARHDAAGGLHVPSLQIGTSTTAGWVLTADALGNATWAAAGSANAVVTNPAASATNTIQPTAATVVPLTLKGFASQTADLLSLQNSAGAAKLRIGPAGELGFYGVTPVAQAAARTLSNWTVGANALRTIDRNNWTSAQLFDFVSTLAYDLQQTGLLA